MPVYFTDESCVRKIVGKKKIAKKLKKHKKENFIKNMKEKKITGLLKIFIFI